ncbi:hypothetical protein GAPWK_1708 [Gilliamella apicola]|uniref:hypothetical protein n=1 Tax=Gilliamella apicola TaxID=1196095 RepID=UPI00042F3BE0|nr:hypothetical protein [Gilliamella apicola]AHN26281.1 hypothetical protein GAPWK_1708 [Gilliamella apicola]
MVKHDQNQMDQVILDCFAGLNKLEQSISERICHYILYGKDVMVLDDLNVLPKTNKYDEGCYILLGMFVFDQSNQSQQKSTRIASRLYYK